MVKSPDYFVSFCLAQEGDLAPELDAISALSASFEQRLRYWEIVYVAGESHRFAVQDAINKFVANKNLRIVLVRDAISYYRRRKIAASEAIGDVVVLTSFSDMSNADLLAFAEEAVASDRIVIGYRAEKGSRQRVFYWLADLISRYHVDARALKIMALPRKHLVAILKRPTAQIDLRFEPQRRGVSYVRKQVPHTSASGEPGLKQRLALLVEMISSSAAHFLNIFALVAGIVSTIAAGYGLYAVAVILLRDNIQPGWFTTAIAQSGTAAFLSLGFAVIALGIANILDRMDEEARHEIVEEIGNISFYDHGYDLNVETSSGMRKVDAK
jgi:hypothetical protein